MIYQVCFQFIKSWFVINFTSYRAPNPNYEPTVWQTSKIKQKYTKAIDQYFECIISDTSGDDEYDKSIF